MCSCSCKTFVKDGVCMHVFALSTLFGLQLFHPKYSATTKPDTFVNKIKRGRRGKKGFVKALDKPNAAKVTEPKDTSTPKSSPERAIVKSKKARIEKGSFPVRTSARISKQKL